MLPLQSSFPIALPNGPSRDTIVTSPSIFLCTVDTLDFGSTTQRFENGPLGLGTVDGICMALLSPRWFSPRIVAIWT